MPRHRSIPPHKHPPGSRRDCPPSKVRKDSHTSAGVLRPPFRAAPPAVTKQASMKKHTPHKHPPGSHRDCPPSKVRRDSRTSAGVLRPPFQAAPPTVTEQASMKKHIPRTNTHPDPTEIAPQARFRETPARVQVSFVPRFRQRPQQSPNKHP